MIDISKAKKELSPCIKYIVKWFDENGFDAKLTTYNTNKTVFEVSKDGVNDRFEITVSREKMDKIKDYMTFFAKSFDMKCENERIKRELKAMNP